MPTTLELRTYIQGRLTELKKEEELQQKFGLWRDGTSHQMWELRLLAREFHIPLDSSFSDTNMPPAEPDPSNVE